MKLYVIVAFVFLLIMGPSLTGAQSSMVTYSSMLQEGDLYQWTVDLSKNDGNTVTEGDRALNAKIVVEFKSDFDQISLDVNDESNDIAYIPNRIHFSCTSDGEVIDGCEMNDFVIPISYVGGEIGDYLEFLKDQSGTEIKVGIEFITTIVLTDLGLTWEQSVRGSSGDELNYKKVSYDSTTGLMTSLHYRDTSTEYKLSGYEEVQPTANGDDSANSYPLIFSGLALFVISRVYSRKAGGN